MKSDAVTAVGIALVDLPLAVEPHSLFGVRRTEMESRAGAPLARLTVAKVNPIRLISWQLLEANRSGIDQFVPLGPSRVIRVF